MSEVIAILSPTGYGMWMFVLGIQHGIYVDDSGTLIESLAEDFLIRCPTNTPSEIQE